VVNSQVPLKGTEGLELIHRDQYRNVLYDPAVKPLVYWADWLNAAAPKFSLRTNIVEIKTQSSSEGVLIINVLFNPFFRGYLDGRELPVTETEDGQMSVVVPAGNHKVELQYIDSNFRKGLLISLVFLLSAGVFIGMKKFKSMTRAS
jgi:uncharacterized membrane protein YfhO